MSRSAQTQIRMGGRRLPRAEAQRALGAVSRARRRVGQLLKARRYAGYYSALEPYTMVPGPWYVRNLLLIEQFRFVPGIVVECGTWKGGMIAGIARVLGPSRRYFLFDSYQGLPAARDIDGPAAREWQESDSDNCTASEADARAAMSLSGAIDWHIVPGWFEDTLPGFDAPEDIAVLRLDGDWYESTATCLEALYPRVAHNGIVIIDDYYVWDGCARAVHDYLAAHSSDSRISQFMDTVAYIQKK